jgi:leucyl aminopeptidase
MGVPLDVRFSPDLFAHAEVLVVGVDEDGLPAASTDTLQTLIGSVLANLKTGKRFTGANQQILEMAAPVSLAADRLCLIGLGKPAERDHHTWEKLGGALAERYDGTGLALALSLAAEAEDLAHLALGLTLRGYRYDQLRTRALPDDEGPVRDLLIHDPDGKAERFWRDDLHHVSAGVLWARDLFAEPANLLYPEVFVERLDSLGELGVTVEALGPKELRNLGMGAMLAVAQGSACEPRLAILKWQGADDPEAPPLAFVGKGMTFDSGGITLKPAKGMEEMKGDMAGAAAVVGALRALAGRRAKVNAIGVLGLAENMPGARAYRPGDIVKTMAGWTVEVIDTDAEGRMVLSDALWYTARTFKPRLMVDLATLTYAVMAGLGLVYTGLYATDDALADDLLCASRSTGEKIWRLPLDEDYEANLGSDVADLRQIAEDSEMADCAHAAQFLSRFANGLPWAHLDIAGKEMAYDNKPLCPKGPTGVGVRLLDALARRHEAVAD